MEAWMMSLVLCIMELARHGQGLLIESAGVRAAGVSWDSRDKRWLVKLGFARKRYAYMGSFANEVDAALAYDQAALKHHRKNAMLNFPDLAPQPQVVPRTTPLQTTSQYRGKSRCTQLVNQSPWDNRLAIYLRAYLLVTPIYLGPSYVSSG
jgi:hypothetical protein